jgi:hypothetical protein
MGSNVGNNSRDLCSDCGAVEEEKEKENIMPVINEKEKVIEKEKKEKKKVMEKEKEREKENVMIVIKVVISVRALRMKGSVGGPMTI